MKIIDLQLNNFRNYSNEVVKFFDGVNFIVGKNAQGKTNMLESLYILSVGKSPKNSKEKQIIKFNEEKARLSVNFLTNAGEKNIQIFLDKQNKKIITINKLNILKLTEIVGKLCVVYFSPDELKLIKEVPEDRRNFLDVSISQFDKVYLYDLIKYNKILKMRNSILKSNESYNSKVEQLKLFTPQLVETASKIIEKRLNFVENLNKLAKNIHFYITKTENLEILYSYKPKNISIIEDLNIEFEKVLNKEIELGYTCIGPHRDDLIFKINDLDSKFFASQGQQRTIALVVKLALMELIKNETNEYPILLLDDVLSELDFERQESLLNLTTKYQTLITCTQIPNTKINYNSIKVEDGKIS